MNGDTSEHEAATGAAAVPVLLLIGDQPLFRATVERYIRQAGEGGLQIVSAGGEGELIPLALALRPRIVVLDLGRPADAEVELIRRIRTALPSVGIIALGWPNGDAVRRATLNAGADRFLAKDQLDITLLPAVDALRDGREAPEQLDRP